MTILIVDDSAPIRAFIRTILEESGYRVLEAADSDAARRSAPEADLALIDLQLGRESGQALVKSLVIPSILVTGHHLPTGAYLRKPFTPTQLLEAVRSLTTKPIEGGPPGPLGDPLVAPAIVRQPRPKDC